MGRSGVVVRTLLTDWGNFFGGTVIASVAFLVIFVLSMLIVAAVGFRNGWFIWP